MLTFKRYTNQKTFNKRFASAEKLLNETIKEFPNSIESYNALAKLKIDNKEISIADSLSNKAIQIAKSQKLRQWQINELTETKEKIKSANAYNK